MKEYSFNVTVKWTQAGIEAENDEEAIEKLQDTFEEEFNFRPEKDEIKIVERKEA
jgi:hypothetical protein